MGIRIHLKWDIFLCVLLLREFIKFMFCSDDLLYPHVTEAVCQSVHCQDRAGPGQRRVSGEILQGLAGLAGRDHTVSYRHCQSHISA